MDRLGLYSKFCRFLWFRELNYVQQHGYNGTLGDTIYTVTMSRDIEMPGHVVLSTAVASGLCLVQLMQTGYRTLFCGPPSLLFIGYVVSCYTDKTDRA